MYTYDLCICAVPGDRAIAQRLADSLRGYKLPKGVSPSGVPSSGVPSSGASPSEGDVGYRRVYMDIAEGDFDEQAASLADQCRFFLLLCSPESKASQPAQARMGYFEQTRGKQSIIAVIARGEPVDAFPPSFIEEKLVAHILPDGTVEERVETVEPVASDLRGQSPRHLKQLVRYETVRIVATLLGLRPDELEQRHNRRARRRMTTIAATASAVLLAVAAVCGYFALAAQREGKIAQAQTDLSMAVIERMMTELPQAFADHSQAGLLVYDALLDGVNALYRAGSVNLEQLRAYEVLHIQPGDSTELMLRKATATRLIGAEDALPMYSQALEALRLEAGLRGQLTGILALWVQGSQNAETGAAEPYGPGICLLAQEGEMRAGDIIGSVDGTAMGSPADWQDMLDNLPAGQALALTCLSPAADGAGLEARQVTATVEALRRAAIMGI